MDPNTYPDSNPIEPNRYPDLDPTVPNIFANPNPMGSGMLPDQNPTVPNIFADQNQNQNPMNPGMFPDQNPNQMNPGMFPNQNPMAPNIYPGPGPNSGREGGTRRLLIIIGILSIVLLGLIVGAIAVVIGRSGPATASTNPTPTVSSATTATVTTKPKTRRIIGVIQSINQQSVLVVPKNKKKPVAIMLTSTTKYRTSSGQASFSSLQVGQTVEINASYNPQAGTWNATRVIISPVLPTPTTTP